MSEYMLFGETVQFSEAADRYWQLQYELWLRCDVLGRAFDKWYGNRDKLEDILSGCEHKVEQLMEQNFVTPFFLILSQYQLTEYSTGEFRSHCADTSAFSAMVRVMEGLYQELDHYDPGEAESRLREAAVRRRPEPKSKKKNEPETRVELLGPDAPGNPFAEPAYAEAPLPAADSDYGKKKHLSQLGGRYLRKALENSFMDSMDHFVELINREFPDSFAADFDYPRSEALLAGEPGRDELLEAFRACPWNPTFYTLSFAEYAQERPSLFRIAKTYHLDLTQDVEDAMAAFYASRPNDSESTLRRYRGRIQEQLKIFGLKTCPALDEVESDILGQICAGYEEAGRLECCQMELMVHKQELAEKNKLVWMKKLQERLDELASGEDGVNFDEYLLKCDVLDVQEVARGLKYVEADCPPESRDLYLDAFRTFTRSNIRSARQYEPMSGKDFSSRFLRSWGVILMAVGAVLMLTLSGLWLLLGGAVALAGLILQIHFIHIHSLWNRMTLRGTIVHKVFKVDGERFKKLCEESDNKLTAGGVNLVRQGKYD